MESPFSKIHAIQRIRGRRKNIVSTTWDGKSRPSTKNYRENFNNIFKKKKQSKQFDKKAKQKYN